jgi:tetratricopeptide (TPR) repeat protein
MRKRIYVIALLMQVALVAFAQNTCQKAETAFANGEYEKSISYYNLCNKDAGKDVSKAIEKAKQCRDGLVVANNYFDTKDYENAAKIYADVIFLNPKDKYANNRQNEIYNIIGKKFIYHDNGFYFGQIKNGKREGFGVYCWHSGMYSGEWLNDVQNGQGIYYFANSGNFYMGEWLRGEISDLRTFFRTDSIYGQRYDNGKWVTQYVTEWKTDAFKVAKDLYSTFLKFNPNDTVTNFAMGKTCFLLNEYDQAIIYLQKSVELDPENTTAYYALGRIFNDKKDYIKAIEYYKKAIAINKNDNFLYSALADTYYDSGDYDKAIENGKKAIDLAPNDARALNDLGYYYYKGSGDYVKAIAYMQKAIEVNPTYAYPVKHLGSIFYLQKKYSDAIKYFEKAIKLKPDYAVAYREMGDAYKAIGKSRKAKECYAKAEEIENNKLK